MGKKVKRYAAGGQERRNPTIKDVALGGFDQAASGLRGLVRGGLGLPGDLESLVRMLAGADPEKGFLPTTEDMDKHLPRFSRASTYQSDINPYDISSAQDEFATLFAPGTALKPFNAAHKLAGKGFAKATKPLVGPLSQVAAKTHGAVTNAAPVAARDSEYTANMALANRSGNAEDWKKLMKAPKGVNESSAEYLARRAASDPKGGLAQVAQMITPRGSNVIKDKGGNWYGPSIDEYLQRFDTFKLSGADPMTMSGDQFNRIQATNKWMKSNLRNYLMTDMGTIDDPLRALSAQGIHTMPDLPRQVVNQGLSQHPMSLTDTHGWKRFGDASNRGTYWADRKHIQEVAKEKGIEQPDLAQVPQEQRAALQEQLKRTPWEQVADNSILQGARLLEGVHPKRIRQPGTALLPEQLAGQLHAELEKKFGRSRPQSNHWDFIEKPDPYSGYPGPGHYMYQMGDYDLPRRLGPRDMDPKDFKRFVDQNRWIADKADPDKPIFRLDPALTSGRNEYGDDVGDYLGFGDVIRHMTRRQDIPVRGYPQVSIADATRALHDVRERAAKDFTGRVTAAGKDIIPIEGSDLNWTRIREAKPEEIPEGLVQPYGGQFAVMDPSTGRPFKSTSEFAAWLEATADTPEKAATKAHLIYEGNNMGHCIGQYCDRVSGSNPIWDVLSLRDKRNEPHITVAKAHSRSSALNMPYNEALRHITPEDKDLIQQAYAARYGHPIADNQDFTEWGRLLPIDRRQHYQGIKGLPTLEQIKGNSNMPVANQYLKEAQDYIRSNEFEHYNDLNYTHMFDPTGEKGSNFQNTLEFIRQHYPENQPRYADKLTPLDFKGKYLDEDALRYLSGHSESSPYYGIWDKEQARRDAFDEFTRVTGRQYNKFPTFEDLREFYLWEKAGRPTPPPALEPQGAIPTMNQTELPGMAAGGLVEDGLRREIAQNLQELMNG